MSAESILKVIEFEKQHLSPEEKYQRLYRLYAETLAEKLDQKIEIETLKKELAILDRKYLRSCEAVVGLSAALSRSQHQLMCIVMQINGFKTG
jgi:hypothetical protein